MKIIDTFLFADACELHVVETKIASEACSDLLCWIVVENCYTFQGSFKGYHFGDLMMRSNILLKHKHKIHYIKVSIKPSYPISTAANYARLAMMPPTANIFRRCEQEAFAIEYRQRDCAIQQLKCIAADVGDEPVAILVSDADELIDLSDPVRRHALLSALCDASCRLTIDRYKFQYDFDNTWPDNQVRFLNFYPLSSLIKQGLLPHQIRYHQSALFRPPGLRLAFEYSYCFSPHDILAKLSSFSHVRPFEQSDVLHALECNTQIYAGKPNDPLLFEKVELTRHNSPAYVRDNLNMLRTNIVNADYATARNRRLSSST
jgi:hypothetical protein